MKLQVLRLLAARRAVSTTITAPARAAATEAPEYSDAEGEDEGPFFDLDFSTSSVRASSSSAGSASSGSESDDAFTELDFIISLHRSRSASPSYDALFFGGMLAPPPPPPVPPQLKFCASEPSAKASGLQAQCGGKRGGGLRTLSFGVRKTAFYGGRPSFARSSSSARSLRLFMESPADEDDVEEATEEPEPRRALSRDVIRRYLTKISRRLRAAAAGEARGLRRLRKSRSASAAVMLVAAPASSRHDDSLVEKQDGIANAIAHCKESIHRGPFHSISQLKLHDVTCSYRASIQLTDSAAISSFFSAASLSECDSPLLRSRSDPGKCEAAA
ncbi:hypothetical protein BAE44_0000203 [Dichanthelium oligosanthes]|uniref:Membrane-associated kinase regulator 2 n=1 Tax=Dichanthelium oligosanthes TaxID=888268 RepID=A0A1E5WN36_9POAL|nr:hypothetical protein BAE44_0000203 [Dichanthelium oligosanthes]